LRMSLHKRLGVVNCLSCFRAQEFFELELALGPAPSTEAGSLPWTLRSLSPLTSSSCFNCAVSYAALDSFAGDLYRRACQLIVRRLSWGDQEGLLPCYANDLVGCLPIRHSSARSSFYAEQRVGRQGKVLTNWWMNSFAIPASSLQTQMQRG
jgi:hypothetical protein